MELPEFAYDKAGYVRVSRGNQQIIAKAKEYEKCVPCLVKLGKFPQTAAAEEELKRHTLLEGCYTDIAIYDIDREVNSGEKIRLTATATRSNFAGITWSFGMRIYYTKDGVLHPTRRGVNFRSPLPEFPKVTEMNVESFLPSPDAVPKTLTIEELMKL